MKRQGMSIQFLSVAIVWLSVVAVVSTTNLLFDTQFDLSLPVDIMTQCSHVQS